MRSLFPSLLLSVSPSLLLSLSPSLLLSFSPSPPFSLSPSLPFSLSSSLPLSLSPSLLLPFHSDDGVYKCNSCNPDGYIWDSQDDEMLLKLVKLIPNRQALAKKMGRSIGTINSRLNTLVNTEERGSLRSPDLSSPVGKTKDLDLSQKITLSTRQKDVLDLIASKRSVFFTGAGLLCISLNLYLIFFTSFILNKLDLVSRIYSERLRKFLQF